MVLPPAFALAAITEREDPRDAFVSNRHRALAELPPGAVVGTSSLRRESQLRARFPQLAVEPLRGNVQTRLRKLDEGQYAAIILAAAGLKRLGLADRIASLLAPEESLPAVGQGALGIECLAARTDLPALLAPLDDAATSDCVRAERAMSRALGGSCQVPLGGYAERAERRAAVARLRRAARRSRARRRRGERSGRAMRGARHGARREAQGTRRRAHPRRAQPACAMTAPLAGRGILVTRPAEQARGLAGLIRAAGGEPIVFPAIEIADMLDLQPLFAVIDRLDEFDIAVFISPSAVNKALNLIRARREWPARLAAAAVGRGSAKELARCGIGRVIAPERKFDSEALLALPGMSDVAGKRVVIFRGDGGRELLGDTLAARGASVEYAECYRRVKPGADAAALLRAWGRNEVAAVTVTSSEGLRNLYEVIGKLGQAWLKKTPVFVTHPRIADTARELGVAAVIVTEQGDEGIVAGLTRWFAEK